MESAVNVADKEDDIDTYNDFMGQMYALRH
jgi:hypothetical protein